VVTRLPIVGVNGSGSDEHRERAAVLGCWLAGQGVHLLTGAGQGVMAAVSRAFAEAPAHKGLVIGIVPCSSEDAPDVPKYGYPNA
jgi:predicted Rossmann-fold nucleotide-binding protein